MTSQSVSKSTENSSACIDYHLQSLVKKVPVFTNGNNSLLQKFAQLPNQLLAKQCNRNLLKLELAIFYRVNNSNQTFRSVKKPDNYDIQSQK